MRVIFLGTNGWYDTETGNTICTLVQTERYDILLDAGNGIHRAEHYLVWSPRDRCLASVPAGREAVTQSSAGWPERPR